MSKDKVKLTINEQIEDMDSKGILFNLCSKEKAKQFLKNNTYYFKLKVFERNYNNNNKENKYKNLDFEYLKELSKIDMYLRKIIIDMCLDIEHILKTRLINDCTENNKTDGYDFVTEFLDNNYSIQKSIIDKSKRNSICSALAANYYDSEKEALKPIPLWTIVELLSFGEFINLYVFYYQKYHRYPDYSRYLGAIKFLRNASAHSNCIIHSLNKQENFSKTLEIMQTLSKAKNIPQKTRHNKMSIPVIHDFVSLLLVYNDLLNTPYNRDMRSKKMKEVHHFFLDEDGRIKAHSDYFSDNSSLKEAYDFVCQVIKFIENMNNKPGSKHILKTN